MLGQVFVLLFAWLPLPLALISSGVVALFFIFVGLHLARFILDLIPFL